MQQYSEQDKFAQSWLGSLERFKRPEVSHPDGLQAWLSSPHSLTTKLSNTFPGLQYRLLSAGYAMPLPQESLTLSISTQKPCWTRYVWFGDTRRDLLFSKVVIPPATIEQTGSSLTWLGATPLGNVLFTKEDDRRMQLQYNFLQQPHPYLVTAEKYIVGSLPACWARRSICYFQQQPMLVCDLFLPDLIKSINEK